MGHTILGFNADNTLTVRVFAGDRVYDILIDKPSVPTLDDLVADIVNAKQAELLANPPAPETLADPNTPVFAVEGVSKEFIDAVKLDDAEKLQAAQPEELKQ